MYEYSRRTRETGSCSTSFKPRLPRTHSARLGLKFRLVDRRKEAFNPAWLGRAHAREREQRESSTEGRQGERRRMHIATGKRSTHLSWLVPCGMALLDLSYSDQPASRQRASFDLLLLLPIGLVSWLERERNARARTRLRPAGERDTRGRSSSGLGSLEETALCLLEVDLPLSAVLKRTRIARTRAPRCR